MYDFISRMVFTMNLFNFPAITKNEILRAVDIWKVVKFLTFKQIVT